MSISVILPVHNAGAFLRPCLDSLLGQTHCDFEIVAVDDGSTDGSADTLAEYAQRDPRLRVHRHDSNQGVSQAMRTGMRLAQRELHARMDSDDICEPDRLAQQLRWMQEHPRCTVLGSQMAFFGIQSGATQLPLADAQIKAHFLMARANICNPTTMWRADWMRQHGIEPPAFDHGEDLAMWVDAMLAGAEFRNLPKRLLRYRVHEGQASRNAEAINRCVQISVEKVVQAWCPERSTDDVRAVASICHGMGAELALARETVERAVAVARELAAIPTPRFGEDRQVVQRHLLVQAALWERALG